MNAQKILFKTAEFDGHDVLFTDVWVNHSTVPVGLYCYDIRHDDEREMATLERHVATNHGGTLICREPLLAEGEEYCDVTGCLDFSGEETTLEQIGFGVPVQGQMPIMKMQG